MAGFINPLLLFEFGSELMRFELGIEEKLKMLFRGRFCY